MSEEVPNENTNEEKDKGGVGWAESVEDRLSVFEEVFESCAEEGDEASASVRPRLSRMTNPRSSSLIGTPPQVAKHYH
jgi:hypothetical protein